MNSWIVVGPMTSFPWWQLLDISASVQVHCLGRFWKILSPANLSAKPDPGTTVLEGTLSVLTSTSHLSIETYNKWLQRNITLGRSYLKYLHRAVPAVTKSNEKFIRFRLKKTPSQSWPTAGGVSCYTENNTSSLLKLTNARIYAIINNPGDNDIIRIQRNCAVGDPVAGWVSLWSMRGIRWTRGGRR